jgi:hypothetical protein
VFVVHRAFRAAVEPRAVGRERDEIRQCHTTPSALKEPRTQ